MAGSGWYRSFLQRNRSLLPEIRVNSREPMNSAKIIATIATVRLFEAKFKNVGFEGMFTAICEESLLSILVFEMRFK